MGNLEQRMIDRLVDRWESGSRRWRTRGMYMLIQELIDNGQYDGDLSDVPMPEESAEDPARHFADRAISRAKAEDTSKPAKVRRGPARPERQRKIRRGKRKNGQ